MNAFALATNLIFNDRHMAFDAIYRPGDAGDGHTVRVIKRAPDRLGNFGDGRFVSDSVLIDVRVSEVAELEPGDSFEIDGHRYEVRGEPVRDGERLTWAAEAREL